jgi:hypothetical protein
LTEKSFDGKFQESLPQKKIFLPFWRFTPKRSPLTDLKIKSFKPKGAPYKE